MLTIAIVKATYLSDFDYFIFRSTIHTFSHIKRILLPSGSKNSPVLLELKNEAFF